MLDAQDQNQESFFGSIIVLVPEDIFMAGDQITSEYINRMIDLFDECTSASNVIVNNVDDYEFLDVMEDKHPEWFMPSIDTIEEAKSKLFLMYEAMGHEVDRTINTVCFKSKFLWIFNVRKYARLVMVDTNSKISKKLMLQPSYFTLLYYISLILCTVFDPKMIQSIVKGNITLVEMFEAPLVRKTYIHQFSSLLKKIEASSE